MKTTREQRLPAYFLITKICFLAAAFMMTAQMAAQVELPPGHELKRLTTLGAEFWVDGLALDPAGGVVVSVGARSRIPCDSYLMSVSSGGVVSRYADPCIDHPGEIGFNSAGELFLVEGAGYWDDIYTVPRGGTADDTRLFVAGAIVLSRDLEFGPDDNMYVADIYRGAVFQISPLGAVSTFAAGFSRGDYSYNPRGFVDLAFDAAGDLYVADGDRETIYRVPSAGGPVSAFASGLGVVSGITFTPDGVLLASVWDTGTIYSISPGGTISVWADGLDSPRGILADSEGEVYVATRDPFDGLDSIVKISPSVVPVAIDIKPGDYPNAVNLDSAGLVPVAILSSEDFDAVDVDPNTVTLAGADVAVKGKCSILLTHLEDVNGDGLTDMVVQVVTVNLDPGQFQDGSAILTGQTFSGQEFEGVDEITIVP